MAHFPGASSKARGTPAPAEGAERPDCAATRADHCGYDAPCGAARAGAIRSFRDNWLDEWRFQSCYGKVLTIYIDHVRLRFVESISISKFKATCLAVLKQVRNTGQPVRVTRFGMAIADVVPPGPPEGSVDWLGSMAGTARTVGDVTVPTSELVDWAAERE